MIKKLLLVTYKEHYNWVQPVCTIIEHWINGVSGQWPKEMRDLLDLGPLVECDRVFLTNLTRVSYENFGFDNPISSFRGFLDFGLDRGHLG